MVKLNNISILIIMSGWISHLTKFYRDRKQTNPYYKYSTAMKDARISYRSGTMTKSRKSQKSRKSRKSQKSQKSRKSRL